MCVSTNGLSLCGNCNEPLTAGTGSAHTVIQSSEGSASKLIEVAGIENVWMNLLVINMKSVWFHMYSLEENCIK